LWQQPLSQQPSQALAQQSLAFAQQPLAFAQQPGSQQAFALAQQAASPHALSQQPLSQQPRPPKRRQRFLPQPLSQQPSHALAQQSLAAAQQVFSQHALSQLPNILFSSSKPKLWLQSPTLTTSAPTNMFHFIEQRLLCSEPGQSRSWSSREVEPRHDKRSTGGVESGGESCGSVRGRPCPHAGAGSTCCLSLRLFLKTSCVG
jgi:hypothetical protein